MTTTEKGDLQFPVQPEQGLQTNIKMEEESSTGLQLTEESRKAPHVLQAGTIGESLQRSPGEFVKQEPDEEQLQRWEVQWQEFLKTMEASQSSWKNPQLRGGCVSSGEVRTVPSLLQGQPVTICHTVGEHISQDLPRPCETHGRAYNRLVYGDFGQVKEETEGQGALGTEVQRQRFRQFLYLEAEGPRNACCQLRQLCHQWLQPERRTKEQILELVILEQFLAVLPPEMLNWVKQYGPGTCSQAATLAEEFLLEKQAAEGPEEQGLEPREEAALNTSEAAQGPLDCWQLPVNREVQQEGDAGGGSCLGKQFKRANEEEKFGLEGSDHMAASDVSKGRANEMPFQSHRGEPERPRQPEQKGICSRAGMRESVPSQGLKPVFKTIIQHRIHPGQKLPTVGGRSFRQSSALVKSEHTQASRPVSYEVSADGGLILRRDIDQLRKRLLPASANNPAPGADDSNTRPESPDATAPELAPTPEADPTEGALVSSPVPDEGPPTLQPVSRQVHQTEPQMLLWRSTPRRSQRER